MMNFIKLEKINLSNLLAVSASIVIHLAIGLLLIHGTLGVGYFTPALNKLNLAWVSLESGSRSLVIRPLNNRVEKKQIPLSAIKTNTINTASIIDVEGNTTVQSNVMKEESSGGVSSAISKVSPNSISEVTAMPATENTAAFVSASPLYRENTPPVYPAIARLRGYEGIVLINAEILPDGRVGRTAISRSSGYAVLDHSAMEAVKQWKFEPATKAGKPFAIRVKLPVKFVLHDDSSSS